MAELTILLRSHHFVVTRITPRGRQAVETFAKRWVQFGFMRGGNNSYIRAALKIFAAATQDRTEYRFHINQLTLFKQHLELHYLNGDLVEYHQTPIPPPTMVELPVYPNWVPHDYQLPVISYIEEATVPPIKLVAIQTGKGKSLSSMLAMSHIGCRLAIIVRPMYMDKWVEDIRKTYAIDADDLMVVRGSNQLMALLMLAQAGQLTSKVILISNKTLQNWIKLYEKFGQNTLDMGYACLPDQMCELLGIGFRLIDEVHQDFHLNFKIDLYTNVWRSCSLSATLVSDDDFINKMYEIAYPAASRYQGGSYHKYIAAKAVIYRLRYPNKVRFKDPVSKAYSHHVLEQCILRNQEFAANYLDMINKILLSEYLGDNYKPGHRAIVFCKSIDMCTVVTDYLKKRHPDMDVRRYVEEDPYEDLMEPDIRVTTLESAGTAVDIPNLSTTVLTTAVSSSQSNIQGFGRLREMKDGTTPRFIYFVCEDIPKHIDYHERKRVILEDRALTYKALYYPGQL